MSFMEGAVEAFFAMQFYITSNTAFNSPPPLPLPSAALSPILGISLPLPPNTSHPPPGISRNDTPSSRYTRVLRPVVEEYTIVQVGVTLFEEEGEGGGLKARPYNFYTFQTDEKGFSNR